MYEIILVIYLLFFFFILAYIATIRTNPTAIPIPYSIYNLLYNFCFIYHEFLYFFQLVSNTHLNYINVPFLQNLKKQ